VRAISGTSNSSGNSRQKQGSPQPLQPSPPRGGAGAAATGPPPPTSKVGQARWHAATARTAAGKETGAAEASTGCPEANGATSKQPVPAPLFEKGLHLARAQRRLSEARGPPGRKSPKPIKVEGIDGTSQPPAERTRRAAPVAAATAKTVNQQQGRMAWIPQAARQLAGHPCHRPNRMFRTPIDAARCETRLAEGVTTTEPIRDAGGLLTIAKASAECVSAAAFFRPASTAVADWRAPCAASWRAAPAAGCSLWPAAAFGALR